MTKRKKHNNNKTNSNIKILARVENRTRDPSHPSRMRYPWTTESTETMGVFLLCSDALGLCLFCVGAYRQLVSISGPLCKMLKRAQCKALIHGSIYPGKNQYISPFSSSSWSEGGSNSQSRGRQWSVLQLSQSPSLVATETIDCCQAI